MNAGDLDSLYTQLCRTMSELGEPNACIFLARFALLAIDHMDDAATVSRLIGAAAEDIADQTLSG